MNANAFGKSFTYIDKKARVQDQVMTLGAHPGLF